MSSSDVFPCQGIILNPCCLMNLYATGCIDEIIQSLSVPVSIATYLYEQARFSLSHEATNDGKPFLEPVDLHSIIHTGMLKLASPSSDEEWMTMIDFAAAIGTDGEAHTLALALHRQWAIGVDEHYSITKFRRSAPQIPLLSTPLFIKQWIKNLAPEPHKIADVIQNIQRQAHYFLPSSHVASTWWKEYTDL